MWNSTEFAIPVNRLFFSLSLHLLFAISKPMDHLICTYIIFIVAYTHIFIYTISAGFSKPRNLGKMVLGVLHGNKENSKEKWKTGNQGKLRKDFFSGNCIFLLNIIFDIDLSQILCLLQYLQTYKYKLFVLVKWQKI